MHVSPLSLLASCTLGSSSRKRKKKHKFLCFLLVFLAFLLFCSSRGLSPVSKSPDDGAIRYHRNGERSDTSNRADTESEMCCAIAIRLLLHTFPFDALVYARRGIFGGWTERHFEREAKEKTLNRKASHASALLFAPLCSRIKGVFRLRHRAVFSCSNRAAKDRKA